MAPDYGTSDRDDKKLALWLKPESEVRDILKRTIDALAVEFGTSRFEPHITIASGIKGDPDDLHQRLEKIAGSTDPMTLYLKETDFRDAFYRSLFVHIAPNDSLLAMRERSLREFHLEHEPYMPHISLMYGEMDAGRKKQIIDRVGKRFDLVFIPDKIHLVRVSGPPESWEEVTYVPLVA